MKTLVLAVVALTASLAPSPVFACGSASGPAVLSAIDPVLARRMAEKFEALPFLWEAVPPPGDRREWQLTAAEKVELEAKRAEWARSNSYQESHVMRCLVTLADGHQVAGGSIAIVHPKHGRLEIETSDWHYLADHAQATPALRDAVRRFLDL
jgi:hypothetical protein